MRWIDTTIRDLIRWIDTTITTRGGCRTTTTVTRGGCRTWTSTLSTITRGVGTTTTTRGGRRPQHANSAQSVTAAVFELRHVDHHGIRIKTQLVTVVAGRPRVTT